MLGKLLKYEMSAVGRILLPLYGALLPMALIMGIVVNRIPTLPFIKAIIVFLFVAVAVAAVLITTIIIVQRFYRNLLGDEGYLMFTLPVTTGRLIWSKGITAWIWVVLGGIIGFLSGLIILATVGDGSFSRFISELKMIMGLMDNMFFISFLEMIGILLLSVVYQIFRIYAAISIGHLWSSHRILGAILSYVGLATAELVVINLVLSGGLGRTMSSIQFAVTPEGVLYDPSIQKVFLITTLLSLLFLGIYYSISRYILRNKLNLE